MSVIHVSNDASCLLSEDADAFSFDNSLLVEVPYKYEMVTVAEGYSGLASVVSDVEEAIRNDVLQEIFQCGSISHTGGSTSFRLLTPILSIEGVTSLVHGMQILPYDEVDVMDNCSDLALLDPSKRKRCDVVKGGLRLYTERAASKEETLILKELAIHTIESAMEGDEYVSINPTLIKLKMRAVDHDGDNNGGSGLNWATGTSGGLIFAGLFAMIIGLALGALVLYRSNTKTKDEQNVKVVASPSAAYESDLPNHENDTVEVILD